MGMILGNSTAGVCFSGPDHRGAQGSGPSCSVCGWQVSQQGATSAAFEGSDRTDGWLLMEKEIVPT